MPIPEYSEPFLRRVILSIQSLGKKQTNDNKKTHTENKPPNSNESQRNKNITFYITWRTLNTKDRSNVIFTKVELQKKKPGRRSLCLQGCYKCRQHVWLYAKDEEQNWSPSADSSPQEYLILEPLLVDEGFLQQWIFPCHRLLESFKLTRGSVINQ